jgi:CheY-specific phosphatase CheX
LLADAAFVFAETSESFVPKGKSLLVATVSLTATEVWELLVVAESEFAKLLAANLLGIEETSDEARVSAIEALGEWVNILAGAVAVECKGGNQTFQIGIPAVVAEGGESAGAALDKAFRRVNLITDSGQQLAVALRPLEAA